MRMREKSGTNKKKGRHNVGKVFKWARLASLLITRRSQIQACVSMADTKGWEGGLKPRRLCNPSSSKTSEGWCTNRLKNFKKTIDVVLVNIQIPTGYCYQADIYLAIFTSNGEKWISLRARDQFCSAGELVLGNSQEHEHSREPLFPKLWLESL